MYRGLSMCVSLRVLREREERERENEKKVRDIWRKRDK